MKRILTKRQMQVISLLSAVILILACGVAYTLSVRKGGTVDAVTPPVSHSILRDARVSANERIAFETNFGGSGSESPVAVFVKNKEIYVFGNTDSSDLDFAANSEGGRRGFGARLTESGRTSAFVTFDFTLCKVIPTQSGFAAAGNEGSVAGLYLISDTLTLTAKTAMPPAHALTACGLYVYDNRYFLIASSHDELTGKDALLMHIYTMGLSLEREKVFSHTYGLTLLDVMPYEDGYILAAAARFQDLGYLTVARFSAVNQPSFIDFNLGYAYTPTSFMPLGDGYAACCDNSGNCELLTLSGKLTKKDVRFLTEQPVSNGKLLFYAAAPYAYTGEKLMQLSDEGRVIGSVEWNISGVASFGSNGVCAVVTGSCGGKLSAGYFGAQKSEIFNLDVAASRVVTAAEDDYAIIAANSSAKSADCPDNFGGEDIWLAKIKLNA